MLDKLDPNLLINLSLGNTCHFIDFGTNRKVLKTIYEGIPFIEYVLNRLWLNKEILQYRYSKNDLTKFYDIGDKYHKIYEELFVKNMNDSKGILSKELKYYKRFLNTTEIRIIPHAEATYHDGDANYYRKILLQYNNN